MFCYLFLRYRHLQKLIVVFAITFVGCSESKLSKVDKLPEQLQFDTKNVIADFCTKDAESVVTNLKFIFVLDKSGSNFQRQNPAGPGNDTDGALRYNAVIDFVTANPDDPTLFYGLINFSTSASIKQQFTNDKTAFLNTINLELNGGVPVDGGWTNYYEAISRIQSMIDNDIQNAKTGPKIIATSYVVFFISDGAPWIGNAGGGSDMQDAATIKDMIHSIVAMKEDDNKKTWIDSIQMHTGYYYSDFASGASGDDPVARTLLTEMSAKGRGDFYEFVNGDQIDFSKFKIPERNMPYSLRDIIVINLNTAWENESLVSDADGDGIGDYTEIALGSDYTVVDSDANGVSDLVEYRLNGRPCNHATCSPAGATNFCNAGEALLDLDSDLLNDCEERILGTMRDNYDSNGDWLPDELALRYGIGTKLSDGQAAQEDPDQDLIVNYNEIKYDTPLNYNNNNVLGLTKTIYDMTTVLVTPKKSCFRLNLNDLKEIGNNNKVRAYVIENTAKIQDKRSLRIAEVNVPKGENVRFTDKDFITP